MFHTTLCLVCAAVILAFCGQSFAADAPAVEGFKIVKLDAFKCATILFTGPLSQIKDAYCKLFDCLGAAGLKFKGGFREVYLYWEGPESLNNVVQIQAAIE